MLEGTKLYGSLQSELKSYLGDAEYNKRLAAIKETYKDIYKGEDAETKFEQELTADLVGDLLFTDKNFVSRLYSGNRNLFQKIFDEVKYLCRVATAGSKQARQLEKIKHTFEEVYKEGAKAQKNTAQEVRWSVSNEDYNVYNEPITISDIQTLRSIERKSINDFSHEDIVKSQKWAYKHYQQLGTKSPFFRAWFGEWRAHQIKDYITIVSIPPYIGTNDARKKNRGIEKNIDTGWDIQISREGETNTISHSGTEKLSEYGLAGIRDLVKNAYLFDTEIHEHHNNNAKNDYIAFDHKLYSLGKDAEGTVCLYKITVEEYFQSKSEPNNKRFHNLKYIEKIADITGGRTFENARSGGSTNGNSTINYSIANLYDFVKKFDKEFNPAPSVSKALLNEDGTPKIFYHGTNAEFTEFSLKKAKPGFYGRGFYFTTEESQANVYGNAMGVFLCIENPLMPNETAITKKQIINFLEAVAENEDYSIENYGTYSITEIANRIESRDAFAVIQDINSTAIGDFGEAMRLFNDVNDTNFDGVITPTETIVYSPNQIKSVTDNIGTFDGNNPDIRYSLSSESDNIVPVKDGIYGKDVLLDDLPIRQTVSKTETVDDAVGDIPIRSDIKSNKSKTESTNGIDDLPIADKYVSARDKFERKLNNLKASISANEQNKANSYESFNEAIAKKQAEYDALKNKNTKKANHILQQIESLKLRRDNVQADFDRKISAAQERYDALEGNFEKYATADQRKNSTDKNSVEFCFNLCDFICLQRFS